MERKLDVLNRDNILKKIQTIIETISKRRGNITFSIDGTWGSGKSFLLEMIQEHYHQMLTDYAVMHYNCWEYDYYDEPVMAICSVLSLAIQGFNHEMDEDTKKKWLKSILLAAKLFGKVVEKQTGIDPEKIATEVVNGTDELLDKNKEYDSYIKLKEQIEIVRECLKEMASEKTIIILVDELDRCVPTYAIKILERLHHIFSDIPNLIVIMAIDRKQISHTIEQLFGSGVDVNKYLQKFISFELKMDQGIISEDIAIKYQSYVNKFDISELETQGLDVKKFFQCMLSRMDIREVEELMKLIEIVHDSCFNGIQNAALMYYEVMYGVLTKQCKMELRKQRLLEFSTARYVSAEGMIHQNVHCNNGLPEHISAYLKSNWFFSTTYVTGSHKYFLPEEVKCRECVTYCFDWLRYKNGNFGKTEEPELYVPDAWSSYVEDIQKKAEDFSELFNILCVNVAII